MAKKATSGGSAGTAKKSGAKAKSTGGKPRTRKSATVAEEGRKPAAKAGGKAKAQKQQRQQQEQQQSQPRKGAADTVVKLLESPLMVDLIAVGATAALAAIAEQRFGRRDENEERGSSAVKAAGKAAAAAMGRRIATEVDQIMKASKEAGDGEEG